MEYTKRYVYGGVFEIELLDERPGLIVCRITGKGSEKLKNEAGGHRWQRVPPTEKRGRTQTSTITVAVLPEPTGYEITLNESDIEWQYMRGSGKGGQNRNKLETAVRATHKPSGFVVRVETERMREQNRNLARQHLKALLLAKKKQEVTSRENLSRKEQVGSGMRGDKIRTIRCQDDTVTCHITGNKITYKEYYKGIWDGLYE